MDILGFLVVTVLFVFTTVCFTSVLLMGPPRYDHPEWERLRWPDTVLPQEQQAKANISMCDLPSYADFKGRPSQLAESLRNE